MTVTPVRERHPAGSGPFRAARRAWDRRTSSANDCKITPERYGRDRSAW
jgi:hypothetical protein